MVTTASAMGAREGPPSAAGSPSAAADLLVLSDEQLDRVAAAGGDIRIEDQKGVAEVVVDAAKDAAEFVIGGAYRLGYDAGYAVGAFLGELFNSGS